LIKLLAIILISVCASNVVASEVQILSVQPDCNKKHQCRFNVTLKHADSGWKHYANYWQVVDMSGKILVERTLYHPHVNEQPFTRSSSPVLLSRHIKQVLVKAGDNVDGLNSQAYLLRLP